MKRQEAEEESFEIPPDIWDITEQETANYNAFAVSPDLFRIIVSSKGHPWIERQNPEVTLTCGGYICLKTGRFWDYSGWLGKMPEKLIESIRAALENHYKRPLRTPIGERIYPKVL